MSCHTPYNKVLKSYWTSGACGNVLDTVRKRLWPWYMYVANFTVPLAARNLIKWSISYCKDKCRFSYVIYELLGAVCPVGCVEYDNSAQNYFFSFDWSFKVLDSWNKIGWVVSSFGSSTCTSQLSEFIFCSKSTGPVCLVASEYFYKHHLLHNWKLFPSLIIGLHVLVKNVRSRRKTFYQREANTNWWNYNEIYAYSTMSQKAKCNLKKQLSVQ